MFKDYKVLVSSGLIILFLSAFSIFYPEAMPSAFLVSTFLVAVNTLIAGRTMGIVTYCITLLALIANQGLLEDFLLRAGMYTFASIALSLIIDNIKATQKQAVEQKEQLKVIADSLTEVLLTIDDESTITFVNPSIKEVFGYGPEEVLGKKLTMLMPEEYRDRHARSVSKYIRTGKPTLDWKFIEMPALRKDGTVFPVEISFGEFKNTKGKAFSAIVRDVSIRKNYQLKLNELASIVESSEDAILSKDLNGIIKTWNKGAEKMFGWTATEIIGQSVLLLFPEEYKKEELEIIEKIKNGESIAHYETVRKRKDGTLLDVSLSIAPLRSANGEIIAVSTITRDITYRKQQESAANIAAERYKAFIDNSDEAIWMIEYRPPVNTYLPVKKQVELIKSNGYIAEANHKMAELYRIPSVEEFIGKKTKDLPDPRTQASEKESEKLVRMFIASDYTIHNWESVSDDPETGNTRYGSSSIKGIVQDGKLVRAWVVQRETTEKRLQEQALEQSKERYKAFIENSPDAIWRTEFTEQISIHLPIEEQIERFFKFGYIAEANQATVRVLEAENLGSILYKPLESVGTRTIGDDRFLEQFIKNGYSLNDYEASTIKNGKIIYTSSSVKGILEGDKWVRAWVVRKDITPQKEYQIERERLLKESEKIREELEIASNEKDRFLANLSHELRTPLVAIMGYSSMLMETNPDSENAKKMISTINKNSKLQVQLIEDLLDLSRIISGKIELHKEFFDVANVIKDSVETLKQQASDKGLQILDESEPSVFFGDKKRLSQVVLNLLSNAVKFTDTGYVKICARVTTDHLTIKVLDTGIGIDPANFSKLFHPFKQLDSSITRAKQGLGLGLSIVKNIVDLHGGKVDVTSKLGEGSEFKVYLPVVKPIPVTEEPDKEIHKTPVNPIFDGIKILLVEDDIDGGGFIKYLYEHKGAEVDWVESAKAAREMIAKKKYSIYVFDLSMPEEDGISLIKSIRAAGDTTKAVALTAFVDSYYERMALENGFNMFLKKPSSLSDLLSIIKLLR